MKITSKNMIIMMILIFLIFNQFLGIAWELVKSFFYCILFMILIGQVSPELYNYIIKVIDLNKFNIKDIPNSILTIVNKFKTFIPLFQSSTQKNKIEISDEISDEVK
jgi:hypothetical protein|uniref:Uncharacterized protein n=1 Tax=viral metagenome TaxID=1070528 RepID=A0A6C0IU14_9ZZZZ